jgi:malonyl-CoA O-methyltransferase
VKELEKKLEQHKPTIEEEFRVMAFETPKDVLKHIQNTGVNAISTETLTKKDLVNFEKEYNIFCSNRPILTYHPIYIKIKNRLNG